MLGIKLLNFWMITSKPVKTFVLTGVNYRFLMDEKESPEIRVNKGDTVRIEFTSTKRLS